MRHHLVTMLRKQEGREPSPTAAIIDTQSVKTTEKGGPRGYDASKKVTGRKRHVAVDTSGLLLGVDVHAADIQDADGAGALLKRIKHLYGWLEAVCHRLRPAPTQVGSREDTRLAGAMAAPVQGLRGTTRGLRADGQAGHDPPRGPPPRSPEPQAPINTLAFKTALRGAACEHLLGPGRGQAWASRRCRSSRHRRCWWCVRSLILW